MKKLTMAAINGNDIDKTVRCQFCSSEMTQGTCHMGSGVNTISYWCKCGAMAVFSHCYGKKIKTITSNYLFED